MRATFSAKGTEELESEEGCRCGLRSDAEVHPSRQIPNLLILQYSHAWSVQNLLLIPRVFFSESVIEKRKPLGPHARRAGWVGCNILLSQIPEDGKINVVSAGKPVPGRLVREEYSRIKKLSELPPSLRGWTVDVLNAIRQLRKPHFSLQEVYSFEPDLKALHPRNENIRPKIRQQLQVLRDLGLLEFTSPGNYALKQ
jgi:type II restriction enzyme